MRDEAKKQIIGITNDIGSIGINVYSSYYKKTLDILFLYGSPKFICNNEN